MNEKQNHFLKTDAGYAKRFAMLAPATWLASAALVFATDPAAPPSSSANLPAATPALRATADPVPVVELPPASDAALFAPPPETPATPAAKPVPSTNVTINLINRLVERGVLSKEDAAELIKQAQQDAVVARQQAVADAQAAVAATQPDEPSGDSVQVNYIPETVKNQIADDVKAQVMKRARQENWMTPRGIPDWVNRFRFFGDIRVRYDGDFYPGGNDNTGGFANFNAINTGAPYDTSPGNTTFYPTYNVDQNRTRFRLRARLGTEVDLDDGFTAGIRIATGNDSSPVSENQTIGSANSAQGGDFSKYSIWLDRGFIRYELGDQNRGLIATIGRFDNPFFSTPIIWADDIGFDGVAVQGKYQVADGVTPFLTAGAFPVFNTDFNFANNNPSKFSSEDKYLYAAQLGVDWKINKDFSAKLAAAFYDFENIEGQLSTPFTPLTSSDQGNTDDTRPSFAQNGNTYMALRDIIPTAQNDYGAIDQFQYYGLATPFREAAVTGRLDYGKFDPFHVSLSGEFITNTAFDRSAIAAKAVNNTGAGGAYNGGPNAWIVNFKVGSAALEKRWDWNAGANYRYVQSDSVVDGFTDSDFGTPLSGTNLKGYTIYGSLALAPRVWMFLRWMSADAIAGPPYKNDMIQFDINTKF